MDTKKVKSSMLDNNEINKIDTENERSDSVRNTARLLKQNASTCRCGAPAHPIEQKGNKYKCIRCHKQFHNLNYNLGCRNQDSSPTILPKNSSQILDMNYYDDAIKLLKSRHKKNKRPCYQRLFS